MLTPKSLRILSSLAGAMTSARAEARRDVAFGSAAELSILVLTLGGPVLLARGVDALASETDAGALAGLLVGAYVLSWIAVAVLGASKLIFTGRIAGKVGAMLALDALKTHTARSAFDSGFDTGHAQGVLERLRYSLDLIIEGLLWRFMPLLLQIAGVVVLLVGLLPPVYALVTAAIFAGFLILSHLSAIRFERETAKLNAVHGEVSAGVGDWLKNLQKIRANGGLDPELRRADALMRKRTDAVSAHASLLTRVTTLQYGVLGAGIAGLLVLAAGDVSAGVLSVGDFVLVLTYVFQFAAPLASFGFVVRQAQICIENIDDALRLAAPARAGAAEPAPRSVSRVEAKSVAFGYSGGERVLTGCDLDLGAARVVAVVGPNGSGKSTLAKLLAGILSPTAGRVEFDGVATHDLDLDGSRAPVVYAPQRTTLFNRSIRDNLLFPEQRRTDADLRADLRAMSFEANDDGVLDRSVGELGSGLSGGQVQKLEIVRLAGMDASVLVLDEITSALDGKSEAAAIERLRSGPAGTVVLVTHRRETARRADVVVFLDGGRIRAVGSDPELSARLPGYETFWTNAADGREDAAASDDMASAP